MKTFEDLDFNQHPNHMNNDATQASIDFENGYGVSVITGPNAFADEEHPYELAVFQGEALCYDTYITDDVISYLTTESVTEYMQKVQELN